MEKHGREKIALLLEQYNVAKGLAIENIGLSGSAQETKALHIAYREAFGELYNALFNFIDEYDLITICDFVLNQMEHDKYDQSYLDKCKQARGTYNDRLYGGWLVDDHFVFFIGNTQQMIVPINQIEDFSLGIWYG